MINELIDHSLDWAKQDGYWIVSMIKQYESFYIIVKNLYKITPWFDYLKILTSKKTIFLFDWSLSWI